jgi:hypothetical protein
MSVDEFILYFIVIPITFLAYLFRRSLREWLYEILNRFIEKFSFIIFPLLFIIGAIMLYGFIEAMTR